MFFHYKSHFKKSMVYQTKSRRRIVVVNIASNCFSDGGQVFFFWSARRQLELNIMSTKRKLKLDEDNDNFQDMHVSNKRHTLDSDEEDSDDYEKDDIHDSDIEGEEDGVSIVQDEVKITPFNMREELEEGHFDKEGHFHWDKSYDIKDNWLDNIDWIKIEKEKGVGKNGLNDDSSLVNSLNITSELILYKQLLSFMNETETVADTLRRLGKNRVKMSSIERLKLKKEGNTDDIRDKITKVTELANEILTKTGNMDIYQLTYESIKEKIISLPTTSKGDILCKYNFDIYADDFNEKEKTLLNYNNSNKKITDDKKQNKKELLWEYKWNENDTELQGPFDTRQMLKWSKDGYFRNGVYVRKVGELTHFYNSNRIDFDLYI